MSAGHVIITGGASGIGLATVRRLLAAGRVVSVLDANAEAIATAAGELTGERCRFMRADVRVEAEVGDALDDAVAQQGAIVGLVNSAGIGRDVPFAETSATLFREIIEINLVGTFIVSQAVVARMGEDGGAIVHIASVSGLRGNVGRVGYGASKGGIVNMTQVMAAELGARNIRVNGVAPGPIDTPLVKAMHDPEIRAIWQRHVPQARYGTPEEVAEAICFLLSDAASYVNGHVLAVDGGFLAAGIMRQEN